MHFQDYSGLANWGDSSITVSIKTLQYCEEKADPNDRMMGNLSHVGSCSESCAK